MILLMKVKVLIFKHELVVENTFGIQTDALLYLTLYFAYGCKFKNNVKIIANLKKN